MSDSNAPTPKGSSHRRRPKQLRSVETLNSILDAASDLFEKQGYDKTTTHQIAAQAGVSVGALYRYFADKESILKDVYRRETSLLRDRILEEFSSIDITEQDPSSLVREALERAFKIYAERPKLRRVLSEQSREVADLAQLRQNQEGELYKTVERILTAIPEINLPDTEAGAYLVALFMESVIEDYLLHRRDHSSFTTDRILDATSDLLISYLLMRRE